MGWGRLEWGLTWLDFIDGACIGFNITQAWVSRLPVASIRGPVA